MAWDAGYRRRVLWLKVGILVRSVHCRSAGLDVSPGGGELAVILRQYCGGEMRLDALAASEEQAEALEGKGYDRVYVGSIWDVGGAFRGEYDWVAAFWAVEHCSVHGRRGGRECAEKLYASLAKTLTRWGHLFTDARLPGRLYSLERALGLTEVPAFTEEEFTGILGGAGLLVKRIHWVRDAPGSRSLLWRLAAAFTRLAGEAYEAVYVAVRHS